MILTMSLLITTLVCLAFTPTRAVGIVGLFLLLNTHPVITVFALLAGGVAFNVYQRYRRRN